MHRSSPAIHTFTLGDYQTNCFVVTPGRPGSPGSPGGPGGPGDDPGDNDCWIVDCGFDPDSLLDFIEERGLKPKALLLTHTHVDHIAGIDRAISRLGSMPMYVHRAEAGFCSNPMLNLSGLTGAPVSVTEPQHLLEDGDALSLGDTTWRVLHTPGHSPGGVCFIHDGSKQAIVGDTLFAGSIGRVDFPTSDPDEMRKTLFDRLLSLPEDTTIHPGHGPTTTIGKEKRTNPFLRGGF